MLIVYFLYFKIKNKYFKYDAFHNSIEWLVIDESDKLFESGVRGFRDQLAIIYKACGPNAKRAMFSATYTVEVAKWSKKNLDGLIAVTVGNRYALVIQLIYLYDLYILAVEYNCSF